MTARPTRPTPAASSSCCPPPRPSGPRCPSPSTSSGWPTTASSTRRGRAVVTDGPFTESVEQIVGFYLTGSADESDLLEVVTAFAEGGDHVELRRLLA